MVNSLLNYFKRDFFFPQFIAQLTKMSKLLVSNTMIGVRTPVHPPCVCEFPMTCLSFRLSKKNKKSIEIKLN
jgi:hypothetical protein